MALTRTQILAAGLVLAVGLGTAAVAWQHHDQPATPVSAVVAEVPPMPMDNIHIMPHRALYEMRLADSDANSSVNNVGGKMMFTWADACDGWTIEQRLDLGFFYNGGSKQRVKTSLATWEAKDGSAFRFSVRRTVNGEEKETFQGHAQLAKDGSGNAEYSKPDGKEVNLSPKTLFPTVHTLQILRQALAGQHHVTGSVFDGADEPGQNDVSAFIGREEKIVSPKDAQHKELRQGRGWPVQMAFFSPDNKSGTPDYEMEMTLLENGVAHDLLIDYGDFTVKATLKEIEPLKKPAC